MAGSKSFKAKPKAGRARAAARASCLRRPCMLQQGNLTTLVSVCA